MLLNTALPASALPLSAGGGTFFGGSGVAVRVRYSVIARASWRVRRSSSSLELFSSMKKCGIFVLGRNALGAQIQVFTYSFDSLTLMLRRSVPTFRCPL